MNEQLQALMAEPAPPQPGWLAMAAESRALPEIALAWLGTSALKTGLPLPTGQGPVLVIPGFGATDNGTLWLRKQLSSLGYQASGWGLGRNLGNRKGLFEQLIQKITAMQKRAQAKVTIIGWSLGGVFARELARSQPQQVAQVICLGAPIRGHAESTNVYRFYRKQMQNNGKVLDEAAKLANAKRRLPPEVPSTAIISKLDGVVPWQAATETAGAETENVQVMGSHMGLTHNVLVLQVIADRLAHQGKAWQAYQPPNMLDGFIRVLG